MTIIAEYVEVETGKDEISKKSEQGIGCTETFKEIDSERNALEPIARFASSRAWKKTVDVGMRSGRQWQTATARIARRTISAFY